jgi:UDP-3-O-[3-hydroxymyristoyl] glucosamine N-acyltransferase
MGIRMTTLVHPSALVSSGVKLSDNVWIGPRSMVSAKCCIESNVMVGMGARLDNGVRVGPHGWIGPGSSIGSEVHIGSHSSIGADVNFRAGIKIGRHCCIDLPGAWSQSINDGNFIEQDISDVARIIGAGYSFMKARS